MERTHIRDDRVTGPVDRVTAATRHSLIYWQALCGVERPSSSISSRHMFEVAEGRILPFPAGAVALCETCATEFAKLQGFTPA